MDQLCLITGKVVDLKKEGNDYIMKNYYIQGVGFDVSSRKFRVPPLDKIDHPAELTAYDETNKFVFFGEYEGMVPIKLNLTYVKKAVKKKGD